MSIGDSRWCPTCRRKTAVIDDHFESHYDGGAGGAREYGYRVLDLDCGHALHGDATVAGPAPGAPYADRPKAASHHPSDLARANMQEEAE